MKRFATLFLLLLTAFASRAQISPQQGARYQAILDSVCGELKVKGATAAVLLPGVGTWQGATGISEVGVLMDTAMHLGLGSNTKTYVACLMLRLQELGMLSLEDTIGTWFPNQPNIPGQIKIRQLLNHTSGLYNFTNNPGIGDSVNADVSRVWQPAEVLPLILAPIGVAGGPYAYCNTNYLLAGMIADAVTGMPLYDALQQYIYGPQGMNNTFMYGFEQPTGTVSHSWSRIQAGAPQVDLASIGFTHHAFLSMTYGAGALMSTVGDNVRFWNNLYSGQILSPASMAQMRAYVPITTNNRYGLGIFRNANKFGGRTILRHGGTGVGYINENAVDTATGICVSVLTNQDSVGNGLVLDRVVAALMREGLFPTATSIAKADGMEALSIYPNPATDRFFVSNLAKGTKLSLRDVAGRIMWQGTSVAEVTEVPAKGLATGVYSLEAVLPAGRQARGKVQVVR
jgi:D-alanyl-D-alanine carboxypeptidase